MNRPRCTDCGGPTRVVFRGQYDPSTWVKSKKKGKKRYTKIKKSPGYKIVFACCGKCGTGREFTGKNKSVVCCEINCKAKKEKNNES